MAGKNIVLTFYRQEHLKLDWKVDSSSTKFESFMIELMEDLQKFGISLERTDNSDAVIAINSYSDVLNAVRISSPSDNLANICIAHIIGKSPNLDLMEDIKRAVNRVAFAPETIPPEDHNRKVCHNCGCGC